jgi:predicted membrane channel-forming protein YqfA (hemolysin III family)
MAMGCSIGLMEHIMKASGSLILLKVMALFGMLKEIFTLEILRMIWRMDMGSIYIQMGLSMLVSLKTMCKKVMEKKNGLMEPNM